MPPSATVDVHANEKCAGRPLLHVEAIVSGYGRKQVLSGIDIEVCPGEIVTVIGHNGAGKSTLLKAVFGMIPVWSGRIQFDGNLVNVPEPREWLERGVAYVPQGNCVFTDLSVRENLEIAANVIRDRRERQACIDSALSRFDHLRDRLKQRAGTLSGGEKQMLALACTWALSPRLLLLDEPSLGLAPPLIKESFGRLRSLVTETGASTLIVEQKVREVLTIADRVCVLRNGSVSFDGRAEELNDPDRLREVYL